MEQTIQKLFEIVVNQIIEIQLKVCNKKLLLFVKLALYMELNFLILGQSRIIHFKTNNKFSHRLLIKSVVWDNNNFK